MPNKFKYNKTGSEPKSIFKGNWAIDTTPNNIGDGPSSVTGFYNGGEIPAGGYTIYSSNGVFRAANDTQLLGKINSLGANVGSASAALTWAAGQANHVVLNKPIENIVTNGLVLNLDTAHVSSFVNSQPTTNLVPSPTVNSYPTYGNWWGTYNTNQYCGNNGCAVHWDIPAIASVSNNIVTTVSAHQIRSFDVITPLTTGGGVSGGAQYLAKKVSDTQFSLHDYNSSQDGSQGYLNPATGRFKVHDSFWLDQRVAVNASSFPTKWFGNPHQPNSALVKEIIPGGFNIYGMPVTDCIRLHFFRADATDGMAYGADAGVTIGQPVTTSFWVRAASPSAVGQYIAFQHYNYGGPGGASGFYMNAVTGAQGEWVRSSFTFTPTHNNLISYWFPSTGDMKIDVANIQIEQKSSVTPFVAGTRVQNTTIYDLAGTNHGTLTNGPIFNSEIGGEIKFDGVDDYIQIPHSSTIAPSTGSISVEAIFKADSAGGLHSSIIYNKENEYEMSAGGGFISYAFRPNWAWVGNTAFNPGQWYHTMVTYDQSYQRLYVNGIEVYSAALSGAIGNVHSEPLRIGARGGSASAYGFFNGSIPVVKVYNRALSASEVFQNFSSYPQYFSYL
jgi:hypothetical protein